MVLDSTSSGPPSSRGPRPAPASGADGMTLRFTDAMWAEIRPIYDAILGLPFNRELAAGTLSRERFSFYMVQDAHYLGAFARALATAAAKATTPEAQVKFAKSAHDAIVVERALHEGFFRDFGITPERFAATRPSPTCAGYGDFLLAIAYQHPFPIAVAALLPCFQIYYEVGRHLYGIAPPPCASRYTTGAPAIFTASPPRPTRTSAGSTPTVTRRSATRSARSWRMPTRRSRAPPKAIGA